MRKNLQHLRNPLPRATAIVALFFAMILPLGAFHADKPAMALQFDGQTSAVEVRDPAGLVPGDRSFSIEFWAAITGDNWNLAFEWRGGDRIYVGHQDGRGWNFVTAVDGARVDSNRDKWVGRAKGRWVFVQAVQDRSNNTISLRVYDPETGEWEEASVVIPPGETNPSGPLRIPSHPSNFPVGGSLFVSGLTADHAGTYHVEIDDERDVTPVRSRSVRISEPDWPMWRFDPERSADTPHAISEDLHLQWVRELPGPKRAWRHQWDDRGKLDFDLSFTPVVAGGRIFVPSNVTDSVTAYDIEKGAELWRFDTDGPVRLAPAVSKGRVYFTSDDGHLYCVNAESGGLEWKFRGGPTDHRLLGNERIINFWAARGGPVIMDGTVYFAAGIWPLHGVFVYALDAENGEIEWVNDTVSSDYVQLPHGGATGYGGLAPQGYIAASNDRLVVPGGRSPPGFLNRHTGELEAASFRAKPDGGYAVHALDNGGYGPVRNEMLAARVDALADRIDGDVFYKLAARDRLFVTTLDGKLYCFGPERVVPTQYPLEPVRIEPRPSYWTPVARHLLAALGEVEGYALMLGAGSGDLLRELLRQSDLHIVVVEPDAGTVGALRDELIAADLYGRRAAVIEAAPATFSVQPYLFSMVVSEDAGAAGIAAGARILDSVLDRLRPYGGVAWLGAGEAGARLFELAESADVDRVAVENRRDHVFARRGGPLTGAAQWTHQYSDSSQTNFSPDALVRAPLGVLWFGGPNNHNILPRHGHGPVPQVAAGRVILPGVETIGARCVYTGRELWEREFPGIGHPFTVLSLEEKHERGESVFMHTADGLGANQLGSPFVSLGDEIYVRYKARVYRLSAASGEIVDAFRLPVNPRLEGRPDWGHLSVWNDLIITTVEPQVFGEGEHYSEVFDSMYALKSRTWDGTSSKRLVVMDRSSGEVLWTREAGIGFRHNAIVTGGDRLYLIDGLSTAAVERLQRRGETIDAAALMALDPRTGEEIWKVNTEIFGTWLNYSGNADILVQGGRPGGLRSLDDEPGDRIAAYQGETGETLWDRRLPAYWGPLSIRGDTIFLAPSARSGQGRALCLLTGETKMRENRHTGAKEPWTYNRRYGCNSQNVSEHLITFRSGYAAYYDLTHDSGTGFLAGFRSGCTNNLVAADGVLNAPDYTRTCTCSYAHQTSLALIHMPGDPNIEFWTRYDASLPDPAGHGLNFGAPGRRVDPAGRTWFDLEGTRRRHPSAITDAGGGIAWVAASVREGEGEILVEDLIDAPYAVRLHFAELEEETRAGERVFDIWIDGEKALGEFDIVAAAGAPLRGTVQTFSVDVRGGSITVELRTAGGSERKPVISGIELIVEDLAMNAR